MTDDTRDRLIRLEADMEHMTQKVAEMNAKVTEMHALMLRGKGAWWMLLGLASIGGFIGGKLSGLLPYLRLP